MIKKMKATRRGQFLAKMREHLIGMKIRLVQEINSEARSEREGNRDDCMDSSDLASEEYEREMSSKLSAREQFKIGQIDDVLQRIAKLGYGVCETCGLEITEARLNAMPFTRLCCDCQQDHEREAKGRGRHGDEEDPYHKLGSIHAGEESAHDPLRSPVNESNA
jgi:DnaK suppressor protein